MLKHLTARNCVTVGTLSLLALPSAWTAGGMSVLTMPFDLSAPISAGLTGLFSALLWIWAAWDPDDQLSNAAAAGYSGATAAFGTGSISLSPSVAASQPWLAAHWAVGSYLFGWLIVLAVLVTIWRGHLRLAGRMGDTMHHERTLLKAGATASPVDFSGVWRNQLGSKATLTVTNSAVSGSYESAVSGAGEPITGKVAGYVNGDLISFVVNWPTAAITAWVGQMVNDNGNDVITTLWQMTTNIPDASEPTGMWQSVFAGADRFHR